MYKKSLEKILGNPLQNYGKIRGLHSLTIFNSIADSGGNDLNKQYNFYGKLLFFTAD